VPGHGPARAGQPIPYVHSDDNSLGFDVDGCGFRPRIVVKTKMDVAALVAS
jgi:hypothetical protein